MIQRNALPAREPVFFRDGETVMFTFVIDERNTIGPRPATARDRAEHAEAYRSFAGEDMAAAALEAQESPQLKPMDLSAEFDVAAAAPLEVMATNGDDLFNGADPAAFDHDGDGQPGGSKARRGRKPRSS